MITFPLKPETLRESQNGEDGILRSIFETIGTTNRFLVDIGANNVAWGREDGAHMSNTRWFLDQGWTGERFDVIGVDDIHAQRVTAENICELLHQYKVPTSFDLLSIDIDGIDWWVLRSLLREFHPRVIVSEFNYHLDFVEPVTVLNRPEFRNDRTHYWGANLKAFEMLTRFRGYALIELLIFNAFYVDTMALELADIVPPTSFENRPSGYWFGDPLARRWHRVTEGDLL
jgi:hypothetical protein